MEDKNVKEGPARRIGSTDYNNTPSNAHYGPDSQSQSQNDKNDVFGSKDPASYALPNLSLMMPKKYDDSQDTLTQDGTGSQDLHNGHNIQNDKVVPRTLSISELEPAVEGEPDTMPIDDKVHGVMGTPANDCPENNSHENMDVDFPTATENDSENMAKEKSPTDEVFEKSQGQDALGTVSLEEKKKSEVLKGGENSMDTKNSEGTIDDSQGFDLHLSETQSFMPPDKSESPINCDSDESKPAADQPIKKESSDKVDSFDEQSNESELKKLDSFDDQSNESEVKKVESSDEHSNESELKKVDSIDEQSNESVIKKIESCDEQSNESEMKKVDSSDESEIKKKGSSVDSEIKSDNSSIDQSNNKKADSCDDKSNESDEKKVDNSDKKSVESMDVENHPEEVDKVSNESDTTQKLVSPKKQVTFEDKLKNTESECSTSVCGSIDGTTVCNCAPACHIRMESISQHLNSACSQLEDFIKLKKQDHKKLFVKFLKMLKEIQCISENGDVVGETKIIENVFSQEEKPESDRKTATKRKSDDIDTPLKANPRKKVAEETSGKPTEKKPVDFKDLKGLAVFAKWPNSGWYYPGIVEELSAGDWKDIPKVTVTFYDGLVRDMKNINILPAYLIPAGSMLCDLEDETEMVVLSCEGSNQNSVEFKLSTKENPDGVLELNFNKLAIKANHMKTIKVQLEPTTTDATVKNMHMVSLDNLVSGRRSSRGKSKKNEDSEEKTEEKTRVKRQAPTPKKLASRRTRN